MKGKVEGLLLLALKKQFGQDKEFTLKTIQSECYVKLDTLGIKCPMLLIEVKHKGFVYTQSVIDYQEALDIHPMTVEHQVEVLSKAFKGEVDKLQK